MDFTILTTAGNIAFYESCEVTEIFLYRKNNNEILNFFTIAVFEEKPYNELNERFLGNRISVNKDFGMGIKQYWLTLEEATAKYHTLEAQSKWNNNKVHSTHYEQLKHLPKQYIPSAEGNRINKILKNNYHSGSYIIEFFNETKESINFLLKTEAINKLNNICEKIKKEIPIDLSVVRDRIGNFIFQFPITTINVDSKAFSSWDGVEIHFAWHNSVTSIPDCLVQVESVFDQNYTGVTIENYNKTESQKIYIGNLNQVSHIKIWRNEPSLLLCSYQGNYIRNFNLNTAIILPETRIFEVNGEIQKVKVSNLHKNERKETKIDYVTHINSNLYNQEKQQLERNLSFKQYKKGNNNGLEDLQKLIRDKDENGVYLWDPYLSPTDIFKTLFYSQTAGVPLRAIGAVNENIKKVYARKNKTAAEIISDYKSVLDNPKHNNFQLNLEFRVQHSNYGWDFHDRFLIFPSSKLKKPQVYSLGTSINSYGKTHHILQEVSHPQPIIDAFDELWNNLNHKNCLVWKSPK